MCFNRCIISAPFNAETVFPRQDASVSGTSMSGFQSWPPAPSALGERAKEISKTLLYAGRVFAAHERQLKPTAARRTIQLLAARRPAPDERTPSSWRACGIVPHDVGARRQISPVRRRDASAERVVESRGGLHETSSQRRAARRHHVQRSHLDASARPGGRPLSDGRRRD